MNLNEKIVHGRGPFFPNMYFPSDLRSDHRFRNDPAVLTQPVLSFISQVIQKIGCIIF